MKIRRKGHHPCVFQTAGSGFPSILRPGQSLEFRRIGEPVHHQGDATVLEGLSDNLPPFLNQFNRVWGVDTAVDHFVETEQGTGLSTPQRMAHPSVSDLTQRYKRRFKNPGAITPAEHRALAISIPSSSDRFRHGRRSALVRQSHVCILHAPHCPGHLGATMITVISEFLLQRY